jgi:hypothetical protein
MFQSFQKYEMPTAAGVLLPKIIIEKKYYDMLNIVDSTSNFDFLRHLAHKGVKDKGIDKLPNKQVYYDRAKMELSILNELGFIDYILLNWDILKFCHENNIPTGPGRGSAAGSLILFLVGVPNSTVLISTVTGQFPLSLLAKNKSTAVTKAPFESLLYPFAFGASPGFPPTVNDCASGST